MTFACGCLVVIWMHAGELECDLSYCQQHLSGGLGLVGILPLTLTKVAYEPNGGVPGLPEATV